MGEKEDKIEKDLEDIKKDFRNFVEKQAGGNVEAGGLKLWEEKFDLRVENRSLREEIAALKQQLKDVPKDGKVLTKDEAIEYEAFKALEKKPEELKQLAEKVPQLEENLKKQERKEKLRKVAQLADANEEALGELAPDLDYFEKEVTIGEGDDKQKVQQVFVRFKDDSGTQKEQELREYVRGHSKLKIFEKSLFKNNDDDEDTEQVQALRRGGKAFGSQSSQSDRFERKQSTGAAKTYLENRREQSAGKRFRLGSNKSERE